jgi:hypothetical protein
MPEKLKRLGTPFARRDNQPAKFLDYRFSCVKLCLHPSVSGKSVGHA